MTSIDIIKENLDMVLAMENLTADSQRDLAINAMKKHLTNINNIKLMAEGIDKSGLLPNYSLPQIIEEIKGWAMNHICAVCKKPIDESLVIFNDNNEPVHPGPCYNFSKEQPVTESGSSLNEVELLM